MSIIRLFHVNAFSRQPFGGNPAVVVLGPAQSDAQMQAMAAEFNLSETAFLSPLGAAHYRLRWFTPRVEVDLCGHGTLAAAHVLWQTGAVAPQEVIRFETRSGELLARREGSGSGSTSRASRSRLWRWILPMGRRSVAHPCRLWPLAPSFCWSWQARRKSVRSPPIFTPCAPCQVAA